MPSACGESASLESEAVSAHPAPLGGAFVSCALVRAAAVASTQHTTSTVATPDRDVCCLP
eukprot:826625-Pleurochrysis_carterae.AAC.9